ncbi:hypothetical protein KSX_49320 [Ktedonospora formicarum]|uniref:Uncharacterized protein n=1 Tax=Ktedonospora formicarum TaxID=2778364 RepID=A0A8J3HZV4_9CHLR|nr:hypothetical protein KSX_49320 [Ktedonospora formicarum]
MDTDTCERAYRSHLASRLRGLCITHEENGTSLLSGIVKDQAALYGALLKVRALSVSLLALESMPNDPISSAQQDERIR